MAKQDAIKISDLPDYVSEKLSQFDVDGDGLISIDEILQKGAEVEHLKYKARRCWRRAPCCCGEHAADAASASRRQSGIARCS
jgi:hypothetical protein